MLCLAYSFPETKGKCITGHNYYHGLRGTLEECKSACVSDNKCRSFIHSKGAGGNNCSLNDKIASEVGSKFVGCGTNNYYEKTLGRLF